MTAHNLLHWIAVVLLLALLLAACAVRPLAVGEAPAPAPTAAALTTPPLPAEVAGAAAEDALAEPEAATSDRAPGGLAVQPQGGAAPLRAGEIDDNRAFAAYLDYLATYQGPPARPVAVNERYLITVRDADQRPLHNAQVTVYGNGHALFRARTYAGGQTLLLPGAHGIPASPGELEIVAEYGGQRTVQTLVRGGAERIELVFEQAWPGPALELDVLFLLDTTGSMGDELSRIQATIDDIAERIDAFTPRPQLRFGLVAYRDHGDDYITRSYDFTADIATFRALLDSLSADGGGDTPEALDAALAAGLNELTWSDDGIRLVFLVADAAPHINPQSRYDYLDAANDAVGAGVKIYPIAASNTDAQAEYVFRQLAQQTLGRFIFLTYQPGADGGPPGDSTSLAAGDQPYSVERLDDLIVQVVQSELALAVGAR